MVSHGTLTCVYRKIRERRHLNIVTETIVSVGNGSENGCLNKFNHHRHRLGLMSGSQSENWMASEDGNYEIC